MFQRVLVAALLALLVPAVVAADTVEQKEQYPFIAEAQFDQLKQSIAVAYLSSGEYYDKICPSKTETRNVVCMDPPPFWLEAKAVMTLHGANQVCNASFT